MTTPPPTPANNPHHLTPTTSAHTDERSRSTRSRRPRHRRGLRVGVVLTLAALVPGLGLVVMSGVEMRRAHAGHAAAQVTAERARETLDLVALDAALVTEMMWDAKRPIADILGIPVALLDDALGLSVNGPYEPLDDPFVYNADGTGSAIVDELIEVTNSGDIADRLLTARTAGLDTAGLLAAHTDIRATVNQRTDAALDQLITGMVKHLDEDLLDATFALVAAVDLQRTIFEQFVASFAMLFELRDPPQVELERLIHGHLTLEALATTPQRGDLHHGPPGEPFAALLTLTGELITDAFTQPVPSVGQPLTPEAIIAEAPRFTEIYRATIEASVATAVMLEQVTDTVIAETARAHQRYAAARTNIHLFVAAIAVATLLGSLWAARFIVRPMRALAAAADGIRHDEPTPPVPMVGPVEVRCAALAINESVEHVDRLTAQAKALSAGRLDADVLDEPITGGLGAALQSTVTTLRNSLLQHEEFRRRLAHEAAHDGLTQLPNRTASLTHLDRALARSKRTNSTVAVLFIDLDRFKDVNDTHGHQAGDTVLLTIARRLVTTVREGDHVGRLGGDEFVVIAEPVNDIDDAMSLARRIVDECSEPIDTGAVTVTVGASIGIAITDSADLSGDELLRDADLAVYRAKELGRGGIEICDEDLRNNFTKSLGLSIALQHAIDHDELVMHFQPIVDTTTRTLHALEALVRWQRPGTLDLVTPGAFIDFAERSNLIIELDCWVIDAVARQIADWANATGQPTVPVAINISGRHLAHDDFVHHILDPLARHDVDPDNIIIEITESALVNDTADAATKLQQLRSAGILVSIDDFGTGYTSLGHLRALPIDILKIDRSFTASAVLDDHEASVVKLIIDTGHLLGATITAEGIENADEATMLTGLGSDTLQGFYFARPQPADAFPTPHRTTIPTSHNP